MRSVAVLLGAANKQFIDSSQNSYGDRMDHYNAPAISRTECPTAIPLTVRVKGACRLTGIGRSKLYKLIAANQIDTIKVGTITLIPMASLKLFLKRKGLG